MTTIKTKNISVHLNTELFDKLGEIATYEGTTKAGFLRSLLIRELYVREIVELQRSRMAAKTNTIDDGGIIIGCKNCGFAGDVIDEDNRHESPCPVCSAPLWI